MNGTMITLSHVSLMRPGMRRASLSNVTASIDKGEFVFVIGPSGSGKTSILRLLMRQAVPTWGTIAVENRDLARMKPRQLARYRRSIGFMSAEFELTPDRSAYENVAHPLELLGKTHAVRRRIVPELLEIVGLGGREHRYPHELSTSERWLVMAARACVNRPRMLLADDPTAGMDQYSSIEVVRFFDRVNRAGATVVMTTNDPIIVNHLRRRVLVLDRGKLMRDQQRAVYG